MHGGPSSDAERLKDLEARAQALVGKATKSKTEHEATLAQLTTQVSDLRKRLQTLHKPSVSQGGVAATAGEVVVDDDSTFIRKAEWHIKGISDVVARMPKNESIWSPEFTIFGIPGVLLEFFPNGRDSTATEGFCSLFLWCPPGVKIKYRLSVGSHQGAPDEDEYTSRMGHGHSNFCSLAAQCNSETNSLMVGLDILDLSYVDTSLPGMKLTTLAPESHVAKEAQVISQRHLNEVKWKIRNIQERVQTVPKGMAICSPAFSIAGIREIFLEFYPNGTAKAKDGYCGLHIRCPAGTETVLTLIVGSVSKGPVKTVFDGKATKGVPEFCLLKDQIASDGSVEVGLKVKVPEAEQEQPHVVKTDGSGAATQVRELRVVT